MEFFVRGAFASLAMLDYPEASDFIAPLPARPVAAACGRLRSAADAVIGVRGVLDLYLNSTGGFRCYDFLAEPVGRPTLGILHGPKRPPDMGPWQYQVCTELPLQTLSCDGFGFYPPADEQLEEVEAACRLRYGVTPRPAWLPLSLGGSDLRVGGLFLTDGEKDPWSAGSIRPTGRHRDLDISHLVIPGAAHHEDLRFDANPPKPQVQRAKMLARNAMRRWIDGFQSPSSQGDALEAADAMQRYV